MSREEVLMRVRKHGMVRHPGVVVLMDSVARLASRPFSTAHARKGNPSTVEKFSAPQPRARHRRVQAGFSKDGCSGAVTLQGGDHVGLTRCSLAAGGRCEARADDSWARTAGRRHMLLLGRCRPLRPADEQGDADTTRVCCCCSSSTRSHPFTLRDADENADRK